MGNDPLVPFLSYRILFVRDFFSSLSFFSLRETERNGNKMSPANFVISPLFCVLAIAGPLAWPMLVYDVASQGNERVSLG